jgi:hypothetical protein
MKSFDDDDGYEFCTIQIDLVRNIKKSLFFTVIAGISIQSWEYHSEIQLF